MKKIKDKKKQQKTKKQKNKKQKNKQILNKMCRSSGGWIHERNVAYPSPWVWRVNQLIRSDLPTSANLSDW